MSNREFSEFLKERDEALASLDLEKVRLYMARNGVPPVSDDAQLLLCVHKARTALKRLPLAMRQESKAWLTERGYHSLDDGDLR